MTRYVLWLVALAIAIACTVVSIRHFDPVQTPIETRIIQNDDGPELRKAQKMIYDHLKEK
jgi:hypothetical protein